MLNERGTKRVYYNNVNFIQANEFVESQIILNLDLKVSNLLSLIKKNFN